MDCASCLTSTFAHQHSILSWRDLFHFLLHINMISTGVMEDVIHGNFNSNMLLKRKNILPRSLFSSSTSEHCSRWICFTTGSTEDKTQQRYCNLSCAGISRILACLRPNTELYIKKQHNVFSNKPIYILIMSKEIKQPINHKNLQGKIYTLIRLSPRKHTLQLQLPRHAGQTLSISSTGMSEYLRNEVSPHQFGMRRGKKKSKFFPYKILSHQVAMQLSQYPLLLHLRHQITLSLSLRRH